MSELLVTIASRFPEGKIKHFFRYYKNQVRCLLYRRDKDAGFSVSYVDNYFEFVFSDFTIKTFDDCFYELKTTLPGYLRSHKLAPGETIVDGGAYVGAFALAAAKLVGNKGTVVAFEPDSLSSERLIQNMKLNVLHNIVVIKKGLWSSSSHMKFSDDHSAGSSILIDDSENGTTIETTTLDAEIERQHLAALDFIKFDIEGAELEAVKGCEKTMKKFKPDFAIASYHIVDGQPTSKKLEDWFKSRDYSSDTGIPEHVTTFASAKPNK